MTAAESSGSIPTLVTSSHDDASKTDRSSTPPNVHNLMPQGTPITHKLSKSQPFTSNHLFRDFRVTEMRHEITGRIVGPVAASDFVDDNLPAVNAPRVIKELMSKLYNKMEEVKGKAEIVMYKKWTDALNESFKQFNMKLHDIHARPAPDFQGKTVKPDIGLYFSGVEFPPQPEPVVEDSLPLEDIEILHGCKVEPSDDPFRDEDPQFEASTSQARDTLGQVTTYATAHLAAQFRTHVFLVLIFPTYARLMRWDRAGVVVTEKIPYNSSVIADFYLRYCYATPAARGHDTSAQKLSDPTVEASALALDDVRRKLGVPENCPLYRLSLGEGNGGYIVGKPTYMGISSPTGRSTRTFIAFCEATKKPVFLKDTWRVTTNGQLPEHKVYERLHANKVQNIAQCKEGADILNHATTTHLAANKYFPDRQFPRIRTFRHYRLVLLDIGRDLCSFDNVKEFVGAMRDATIAHEDAYFLAHILHRDISVGNILIKDNGDGVLVDWDLCKDLEGTSASHAIERTGTWQFIAACLLLNRGLVHEREDDLESFYHVLHWVALRFTCHELKPHSLGHQLRALFGESFRDMDGHPVGGYAKRSELISGSTNKDANFKNKGLALLLQMVRRVVMVRYQDFDLDEEEESRRQRREQQLRERFSFTALFTALLQRDDQLWDENKDRVENEITIVDEKGNELKRKSENELLPRQPLKLSSISEGGEDAEEHPTKRHCSEALKTRKL
ncbi:hypothetical protein M378DRAFT_9337 [Amanita muscaria Koide BX008]|uniref:Fungal-type protein kinase domain-containing protein n=1 Tax=Amanita muscaria (strain Koide BX008) TaxID=946122 RepID=A0A0C2SVW5_AMAMK|nr:hypothetical protein M378DRAFT_9337 [Amanita muscaria Koide BX008]